MTKSPDAFRTISEVAELLETPAHVLRFWESRFPQIRPVKRAGGRRYYRPADVALLTGIRHLLHDEGMTIRGVQKILREQGVRHVSGVTDDTSDAADDAALEAALAATGGAANGAQPLPPAEAETAQIIALQTTLQTTLRPADPPAVAEVPVAKAPENDLFSKLDRAPVPQDHKAEPESRPNTGPDKKTSAHQDLTIDSSSNIADARPPESEAEEAQMEVWAEPAPAGTPTAADASLKIARINAPSHAPPDVMPPTIAQRLRATRAAGLSPSDRATLTVLRAKARSLRDRLGSPPRFGA